MAKNIVKLNESDLMGLIRNTVTRILKENTDEIFNGDSPDAPLAAAIRANDVRKGLGRSKDVKPRKDRKSRQFSTFGEVGLDRANHEIGDADYLATMDSDKHRFKGFWTRDGKSAYIPADMEDISGIRVYDDNWKEGDAPITLGDLPEFDKIRTSHDKFRSILDRAKSLNDEYLEESIDRIVRKVIKESNFGIDPAAKMLYVSAEKDGGVVAFDPKTRRKAFIPREEILSNNPEDIISVSAGTFAKYFG